MAFTPINTHQSRARAFTTMRALKTASDVAFVAVLRRVDKANVLQRHHCSLRELSSAFVQLPSAAAAPRTLRKWHDMRDYSGLDVYNLFSAAHYDLSARYCHDQWCCAKIVGICEAARWQIRGQPRCGVPDGQVPRGMGRGWTGIVSQRESMNFHLIP